MLSFYPVKIPNIVKRIYPNYVWNFSRKKPEIYLTFDDGPTSEITDFVLEQLDKFNAKATFFCIGKNVETNPDLYQKILSKNHKVGNHTQNHLNGWKTDNKKYNSNIAKASVVIKSNLFRPPYGKIKSKQAKTLLNKEYKIIMWDVLSGDFDQKQSNEKCLQNVTKNTKNGSIIVFHDSIKAQEKLEYVLPKVLEYFTERGFLFKAIT